MKRKSARPPRQKLPPPFAFVLDELESLRPRTRAMFGAVAVYCEEKILFILREKPTLTFDNGVWIATTVEHHESLRREFPRMRSIALLTESNPRRKAPLPVTGWQNLPAEDPDFESMVVRACELARKRDPRIGKVPQKKSKR